jgi:hypothetical protein
VELRPAVRPFLAFCGPKCRLLDISATIEGSMSFEGRTTSYRLSPPGHQVLRRLPTAPYLYSRANFVHDKVANEDQASESFEVQPLLCEERFLMTSQLPSSRDPLTSAWQDIERSIEERVR